MKLLSVFLAASITVGMLQPFAYAEEARTTEEADTISATVTETQEAPAVVAKQQKQAVVLDEDDAKDLIRIANTPIVLDSKLGREYAGYKVSIVSEYPETLTVQHAQIINGVVGTQAYQAVKGTVAKSLFFLLLPFLWIIATPISAAVVHSRNKKAKRESIQFNNQIPLTDMPYGSTTTFTALVPLGQTPQVHLSLKDKKVGLTFIKRN